ncbi:M14 family zinc carboxypeptidase [Mycolicibacterium madagascariense]|uniref:M14 family zinc carboxypeptidase n=1 Tax=Mycolicibacterium madagascariense TaxID=212765 RepID=UPI0013CFC69B|nr:M14 family zinc carboxypeptidase [Mycolicibacterium madagascariense]
MTPATTTTMLQTASRLTVPATATTLESSPPDTQTWEVVGTSVQGRPIRSLTIGHGPRRVLFVGGIHGDEPEGAYSTSQLPAAFTNAGLAETVTLTILEDANPDGRAAGTRVNANGVDINRNFPASNFDQNNPIYGREPLSQPESRALKDTIDRVDPNLVMVAHAWSGRKFINFDGPAQELADRFSAASGLPVEASASFAPTPGSLGSYVGRDRGIPILTIEVLKGTDQQVVWEQLHTALLQAIAG